MIHDMIYWFPVKESGRGPKMAMPATLNGRSEVVKVEGGQGEVTTVSSAIDAL